MNSKLLLALANAAVAVATVVVGAYGWRNESALVLLLTATPMFAVLALAFGIAARREAES